ncbi:hypothetical protein FPQ18DRAFT_400931 [Pyronema domesticum]|nr:hypothetical protein FPQ18DRAFT_400931 [Pyronema domesticum]
MTACPSGYASCNRRSWFNHRDGCCPSADECLLSGIPSCSARNNFIVPITPSAILIPRTAQAYDLPPPAEPSTISKEVYVPVEPIASKSATSESPATKSNPPILTLQMPTSPSPSSKTASATPDPVDTPPNTLIMDLLSPTSLSTPANPMLLIGTPLPKDSPASTSLTTAMQAGIGIGLFLLLVGIMTALCFLYRRRRSHRGQTDTARGYAEMQGVDNRISRTELRATSTEAVEMAGCAPADSDERTRGRGNVVVALRELEDLVVARRGREVELPAEKASPTRSWLHI